MVLSFSWLFELLAPSLRVLYLMWKLPTLPDHSWGPKLRLRLFFYLAKSPDVWTAQPSLTYAIELKLYVILGRLPLVGSLEGSLTWRVDKEQFMSREDQDKLPTGLSISAWCPWNQVCLHKTVMEPILQGPHAEVTCQVGCGKQM